MAEIHQEKMRKKEARRYINTKMEQQQ
nr:unnamed protein product [Callosobruchus chinensis]